MSKNNLIICVAAGLVLFGCKESQNTDAEAVTETETEQTEETSKSLTVMMESKSGSNLSGEVTFTETEGVVTMKAVINGMEAGDTHAIHLHETADCSAEDGTSAGGHWNPTDQPHGKWGDAAGYHKGDIGNFVANDAGTGEVVFSTNEWCIGCGDSAKEILGKSVIVHEGADDFTSQPTGDAGGRAGCGGIIQ